MGDRSKFDAVQSTMHQHFLSKMARQAYNVPRKKLIELVIVLFLITQSHAQQVWDHVVDLDQNYQLQWTVKETDIIFEARVRTHGYIGFGFSRDGTIYGADIFIGWIDDGHTFYHDCHIRTHSSTGEPVVDQSQDYVLLSSSENATHTILRFRRKLNTCDEKFDVPITNDTMNIIFLYHPEKPKRGQIKKGSLSDPVMAMQPVKSLLLLQRSQQSRPTREVAGVSTLEIRNRNVRIPVSPAKMQKFCHIHRLRSNITENHIVRYEPVFSSPESQRFITSMKLYECRTSINLQQSEDDEECNEGIKAARKCFTIVATWSRGSEGFTFPRDVGYPLDANSVDSLLLEVHYQPVHKKQLQDSSGFRLYHTRNRRKYDAGSLSIGIEPNFLHIIAPGFKRVISVGHCTSNCTQKALPPEGINIFGVNMQTHSLGRKMKIGLVRNGEELAPIAQESNLNADYLENRVFNRASKLLPGDHVTVECTYNTYEREQFTLGGDSIDEEICSATLMYYPRQDSLVSCNSQTNVAHLLKALGIEKLSKSGDQPTIKSPEKYAGRTLERHLQLYDWRNEYDTFDRIIKTSNFDGICNSAVVSSRVSGTPANIIKPYSSLDSSCPYHDVKTNSIYKYQPNTNDIDEENSINESEKIKVTRHSPTYSLELSSSSCRKAASSFVLLFVVLLSVNLG